MSDGSECSFSTTTEWREAQCGQDVREWIQHLDEENEKRRDREEAGYQDPGISSDDDITLQYDIEDPPGTSTGEQATILRERERRGERNSGGIKILGDGFIESIQRCLNRGQTRLVRESISFGHVYTVYKELQYLSDRLYGKRTFFAIAKHDTPYLHYHVVHACPWKWNQCKCYRPYGSRNIRTTVLTKLTTRDWNNEILYLCSDDRQLQYLCCGSTFNKSLRGIEFVPVEGLADGSKGKSVEDCGDTSEGGSEPGRVQQPEGVHRQMVRSVAKIPKPVKYMRPEEIEVFILAHPVVPMVNITQTTIWQASKYRLINSSSKDFQQVVTSLRSRFNNWTFKDYCIYFEENKPMFKCYSGDMEQYYFDRVKSEEIIDELLQFQFEDYAMYHNMEIKQAIKEFLKEVYDICEKRRPKMNSLELIGPASSGKSYFVDMIGDFYINCGTIRNFNKNENFPLQSAYNNRINIWNEAQFEHSAADTVKLFLGGDPCSANIKYEDNKVIQRTPVLITANRQFIPNTQPFNDRMIRYTWKTAPFLKHKHLKPNPLCIIDLYMSYNIIDTDYNLVISPV